MTSAVVLDQPVPPLQQSSPAWKLWLYTNYDCNLTCKYCVARSGPNVPRRALPAPLIRQLVDEATALRFSQLFLTGGEPFLLPDIYDTLAHCSGRLPTTVLTNATLLHAKQLDRLDAIRNERLTVQVSLDGADAATHDAYRGRGTWLRTLAGVRRLLERGYRVRIGTTVTPANSSRLADLKAYLRSLGIPEEDHFIRPLARRGFSREGVDLSMDDLVPELTVNRDGVYWHPLSTERDMQVARSPLPLRAALDQVYTLLADPQRASRPRCAFT
jgi:MoaA/NifB/PqqE/SkfB family radical SAM enzyme